MSARLFPLRAFTAPKLSRNLPSITTAIGRRLHGTKTSTYREDYVFLGHFKHGQPRQGVEKGPDYLKQFLPPTARTFAPLANVEFPPHRSERFKVSGNINGSLINDPTAVGKANFLLYQSIVQESIAHLKRHGSLPSTLILGGDHSISVGSIGAVAYLCAQAVHQRLPGLPFSDPDLVVVWVDAHDDVHTPFTTISGNLHGCPLSALLGWNEKAWKELPNFDWAFDRNYLPQGRASFLDEKRTGYIGFRTGVTHNSILTFNMDTVTKLGIKEVMRLCLKALDPEGKRPIHLTFDIDALDPRIAPSTGTPVPSTPTEGVYGLCQPQGTQIVEMLVETGRLVAMDLVEVNPAIGDVNDVNSTLVASRELMDAWYGNKTKPFVAPVSV